MYIYTYIYIYLYIYIYVFNKIGFAIYDGACIDGTPSKNKWMLGVHDVCKFICLIVTLFQLVVLIESRDCICFILLFLFHCLGASHGRQGWGSRLVCK